MEVLYRQGDVLIKRLASKPTKQLKDAEKAKRDSRKRIVLAEGEVTGHAHAIAARNAALYVGTLGVFLQVIKNSVMLQHEEHGTIDLPAGEAGKDAWYEIVRQREYTPEAIRQVAD